MVIVGALTPMPASSAATSSGGTARSAARPSAASRKRRRCSISARPRTSIPTSSSSR
jgi:hypothetical protein